MTNREKYAEEILDIVCGGGGIAIDKYTGELIPCSGTYCKDCGFESNDVRCYKKIKDWANAEYIEKQKISKRDRAFLDYIPGVFKYIARDMSGEINAYQKKPCEMIDIWDDSGKIQNISSFNVDFPMVKWEDEEPWLIKNLKKLEVVEEYENN